MIRYPNRSIADAAHWKERAISRIIPHIQTALELEASALRRSLRDLGHSVQTVGMRACRLGEDFLPAGSSCVILAGLCGALDPALKIGDIIIDDRNSLVRRPSADHGNCRVVTGKIYTADHVIATAREKGELFAKTRAIAVDMENEIVRRAVEARGVRFIGIRAVSDTADQDVDPALFRLIDEIGRPRRLAAMGLLARRPNLISSIRRLQANTRIALEELSKAVRAFIQPEPQMIREIETPRQTPSLLTEN